MCHRMFGTGASRTESRSPTRPITGQDPRGPHSPWHRHGRPVFVTMTTEQTELLGLPAPEPDVSQTKPWRPPTPKAADPSFRGFLAPQACASWKGFHADARVSVHGGEDAESPPVAVSCHEAKSCACSSCPMYRTATPELATGVNSGQLVSLTAESKLLMTATGFIALYRHVSEVRTASSQNLGSPSLRQRQRSSPTASAIPL